MSPELLVIGATGNQGSGVIRQLAGTDFRLRALTRNPDSEKSKALMQAGVTVLKGDLDDFDSLCQAMEGTHGVFSVQNFMDVGVAKETEQGKRVADAARQVGVKHLVYSSVGGAERQSGVPHFESKWRVEEHIRSLGIPYTILRPVLFMDNFQAAFKIAMLSFMRSTLGGRPVQMIAVDDIGKWVRLAFEQPETFLNQSIEIASDSLTYAQIQQAYREVTGKKQFSLWIPPVLIYKLMREIGLMFRWFREHGYQADVAWCRERVPDFLSFRDWLRQNERNSRQPVP